MEMGGEFGLRGLGVWVGGEQVLQLDALLAGEPPLLMIELFPISYYFVTMLRLDALG
jgi:hypothetical protein